MRPALAFAAFLMVLVIVVGAYTWVQWTPTVPADAASLTIAQATPSGRQDCLDRISNASGWMDVCWAVEQEHDGDPIKDYYSLRVYGTARGEGTGMRWWRVRTNLSNNGAHVADGVFDGWPGRNDGPCREIQVTANIAGNPTFETVCGRTDAEYVGIWGYQVTWTCVGCVLVEKVARPVAMWFTVGVPQGETPIFDIGADLGS